jgi:hypothetical protein
LAGSPDSHAICAAVNELADSPDVARLRLVKGKATLVHRRVWLALTRVAHRFSPEQLAALHEEHTSSGTHRVREQAFPEWVPDDVTRQAADLTEHEAFAVLAGCLRSEVRP